MVAQWVHWASEVVEQWPEDVTQAPFDTASAEEAVRLAERIPIVLARPNAS
jgi:hypothetical protein